MSRVPHKSIEATTGISTVVSAELEAAGEDLSGRLFGAMGNAPELARAYFGFGAGVLSLCGIEPCLRELVAIVVLEALGASNMVARHHQLALKLGVTEHKLAQRHAFRTAPEFTEKERSVLSFADESARDVNVKAETFGKLATWLTVQEQTALTLLAAYYAGLACVAVPLEAEPDLI
ncbi:alkylhydroperoxidase family enzyme [Paraburkholderia phenoliruptrix]|uniref:carboxymuconolactone decarboxylase family protein n=1 Tax=Paraburkholderia phenoliruptrix TaxID=252970 RepID=UPI002855FA67|nr:carboxymuconolactone decarboxylase family protein [Paraburkholderia phenoliruptrix]MDR6423842.1 alkylhydroperoxidase family enzyme [Paraburkholderia phenoliruptrix]